MADPFVAEIRMFGGNFAPRGWAFCEGQLLPISQNTALFSLLGANYGGNAKTNFALPDQKGRAPMFYGQGTGLSNREIGEKGGSETVTLTTRELPGHTHYFRATGEAGTESSPSNNAPANSNSRPYSPGNLSAGQMDENVLTPTGGGLPHNNMMPYLTVNFIIALRGVFPPRS